MSRWSDVPDGRVDLVAEDGDVGGARGWELHRVLLREERFFLVKLKGGSRLVMELYNDMPEAVARCVGWMKG